jgi:hypothetical protein
MFPEISSPKFPTEKAISLNSEIHADLIRYSDSAQLFKVFGLFQISLNFFCVEIFGSQGTEMSKLLCAMVDYSQTASPEYDTIISFIARRAKDDPIFETPLNLFQ